MTDDSDVDDALIESALDDAFPGRKVDGVSSAGISWNEQNETVRVAFADGESVYLKVALDGRASRIVTERAAIEYVDADGSVAVPTVLASDPEGDPPYIVTAPMLGRNLVSGWDERPLEERQQIAREVGRALAGIHAHSFDRHGQIVGGDASALDLDTGTWTDVLLDDVEDTRRRASTDRFEHHFGDVRDALRSNRDLLDDAPAALVYGDPAHPNLFRRDDGIGFIDWEIAHVGDPARELTRVRHQFVRGGGEAVLSALHDGYERRAGSLPDGLERRRPVYDLVWHLGASAVFDKQAAKAEDPDAAAREHEETMHELLDAVR